MPTGQIRERRGALSGAGCGFSQGEISTSSREDQDNGGCIREKLFEDQGNDARIGNENIMTRIRKGILVASRKQSEHQSSGKIRTERTKI